MAQVKLRIKFNEGRTGAPMEKLGDVAKQFERFFRSLSGDLGIDAKRGEWLAVNFKDGSVSWDAALQIEVTDGKAREFNRTFEFIADFDPETEGTNGLVSDATLLEYGRLSGCIDPDEVISIGLYDGKGRSPKKWRQINYRKTGRVKQAIEAPIPSYGSVQGLMHSWFKEAAQPYFQLKEFSSDQLVKCLYSADHYDLVVDAVRQRNTVVHATGSLMLDRASRAVERMRVERIDRVEPLSDEEFRSLFGSAPNLTGDRTTGEFTWDARSHAI